MFGSVDASGELETASPFLPSSPRPYGGYFDAISSALEQLLPDPGEALESVIVDRGELTLHVRRERLLELAAMMRDQPVLRFEVCLGVSGVDYPADPTGRRLHAVYQLLSMTWQRRVRLEVSLPATDAHVPSVTAIWPSANWHERETWDMFGIIFDGHPGLTRILMPDDWPGHPLRKDYPLGGVPVEYKGARVPPPDERRAYA